MNIEPLELGNRAERLAAAAAEMAGRRQIVVELTERALASRPAELIAAVGLLRPAGCAIALDDVGADVRRWHSSRSFVLTVIKLDLALVQNRPSAHVVAIVNAVAAESERSGATVLAEGIETERHARIADDSRPAARAPFRARRGDTLRRGRRPPAHPPRRQGPC